jgi:predicted negative regulator of RcsB-dependent stress response
VLVEQGKVDEADRLVADAERRVGRDDVWTRASLLHARGLVLAAQGRPESAESAFRQALEIIEPTMYAILTREIQRSLDALRAADDVARR